MNVPSFALVSVLCPLLLCCAGLSGEQAKPSSYAFKLAPVDEGTGDPEFARFRERLLRAIRDRDTSFLVASSLQVIHQPLPSSEWTELERMLSLGGTFTTTRGAERGRREFCAPYTYSAYPAPINVIAERLPGHDESNESDPWVILGDRVPVLERPSKSARVLRYLSHDLVFTSAEAPGSPPVLWREIFIDGDRKGWVSAEMIRKPSDYHVCFAYVDGRWRLTQFSRDADPS